MNIALAKTVISHIAGYGSGYVVKSIIANNVSPQTKFDLVKTFVGTSAIGSIVATAAVQNTHQQLNDLEAAWHQHKDKLITAE